MGFPDVLRERTEALAQRWQELVLEGYPPEAVSFLRREKDGFRNPVGATIRRTLQDLVKGLVAGADPASLAAPLDALVRMRAVQGFSPAGTVGFVFLFRRALSDALGEDLAGMTARELLALDARLDEMALQAWDRYASCRDKVSEIRAREAAARTYTLLKRAGLLSETSERADTAADCSAQGRS